MGVENFFKGLEMLDNDIRDMKTEKAIEQARIEIGIARDEHQKGTLKDLEFHRAAETLGNNLALRLSGLGASQSQIEGAFRAIAPKSLNSASDFLIASQLSGQTGDKSYGEAFSNLEKTTMESNRKIKDIETRADLKKIAAQIQGQKDIAQMNNEADLAQERIKRGMVARDKVVPGLWLQDGAEVPSETVVAKVMGMTSAKKAFDAQMLEYKEAIKKHGTEYTGATAKYMAGLVSRIYTTYNKAVELGALAGPDLNLIQKVAPDASSIGENLKSLVPFLGNTKNLIGAIDATMAGMNKSFEQQVQPFRFDARPPAGAQNRRLASAMGVESNVSPQVGGTGSYIKLVNPATDQGSPASQVVQSSPVQQKIQTERQKLQSQLTDMMRSEVGSSREGLKRAREIKAKIEKLDANEKIASLRQLSVKELKSRRDKLMAKGMVDFDALEEIKILNNEIKLKQKK